MQYLKVHTAVAGLLALCACAPVATQSPGPLEEPPVIEADGSVCLSRATTPAIIETVTEQIVVQPAILDSDGSVRSPAVFRTVTRQQILRERREVEFAVPCPDVMTPPFVASVQRALKARGFYRGGTTGVIDSRTQDAIRRYQASIGDVDTGQLTLSAAQSLGLVALPRSAFE